MTERIAELLFKPKSLIRYKDAKFFKVFLQLFILGVLATLVFFIDLVKFDGFHRVNQPMVENLLSTDFSDMAENLPNCSLNNERLTCDEGATVSELGTIGTLMGDYVIVIDPTNSLEIEDERIYLIYTEEGIYYSSLYSGFLLPYDILPSDWQTVDFQAIREAERPGAELYLYFTSGFNQIMMKMKPIALVTIIISGVIGMTIQTLFLSFLFFLFFRRMNVKFTTTFKIAAFAQTLPTVLLLISQLSGIQLFSSFVTTFITFIYMYKALFSNLNVYHE